MESTDNGKRGNAVCLLKGVQWDASSAQGNIVPQKVWGGGEVCAQSCYKAGFGTARDSLRRSSMAIQHLAAPLLLTLFLSATTVVASLAHGSTHSIDALWDPLNLSSSMPDSVPLPASQSWVEVIRCALREGG